MDIVTWKSRLKKSGSHGEPQLRQPLQRLMKKMDSLDIGQ